MYSILPGAALGSTVLGTKFVAGGHGAAAHAARAILPVTGIAFGIYLAAALGLIVSGFVLRIAASRRERA